MKLMESLLLLGLCSLFGTFSQTEAAAVLPGTTKATHGPDITSEKSRGTTEINTAKRSDNIMGAMKVTDVAVATSHDHDTTTESSIIHDHHETNSTTFEWSNTTTETNKTTETNTTTGASSKSNIAGSSTDTSTIPGPTGAVEASRTDVANTGSTLPQEAGKSTSRAVSTPPTTDSLLDHSHHLSEAV